MSQAIAKRQRISESLAAAQADAKVVADAAAAQAAKASAASAAAAVVAANLAAAASKREENFMCTICVGLLNEPVTTPCGHNFCLKCISAWLLKSPSCPLCVSGILAGQQLAVNKLVESAIEANAGSLFLARGKALRFYEKLVALDPAGALAELVSEADTSRFVG